MKFFRRLGRRFREMSPKTIREIIIIAVILCVSLALSLPQYFRDVEAAKVQQAGLKDQDSFFAVDAPGNQGLDAAKLELAAEKLGRTSAQSFLVMRNGKLVYEKYFSSSNGSADSRNNIYSVTKSFISSLVGIAIREGYIDSVEDPVEKYLPRYYKELTDPRWHEIKLKHLLTMTPGFLEDLNAMTGSGDWVRYTFDLPLNYAPGEKFQYANSASHLLSVILSESTGMSTKDFAGKYLFTPLDITDPQWMTDPQDNYAGYAGIYLRPRDLAKFGWLYCSGGKWDGRQIVPEEWVADSTKVQYDFNKEKEAEADAGVLSNEQSTAKSDADAQDGSGGKLPENGYGYKWWIGGKTDYHEYSARGYGGQSITVIPELGLVVVITSLPEARSIGDEAREEIIAEDIIGGTQNGTVGN
jgi:CubicO group peptidase (beta-lactamase class C family)